MTWRKQLRPGKFRDAAFQIDGHDTAGGRRVALHEYPRREDPYAEDLGRKAREFSVDCVVVGGDYMAARDALIAALEQPGPGTLVHPYLGTRQVSVTAYRLRESSRDGGVAQFAITFVESGRAVQPAAAVDTVAAVDVAADAASDAAVDEFAEGFSVADVGSFVGDAAVDIVEALNADLRTAAGRVAAATSPVTAFSAQLDQLGANLSTLIGTPAALGADIAGVMFALAGVARDANSALAAYQELDDFGAGAAAVPETTATRVRQADNQTALHRLIQTTAAIEAVRASAQIAFASSTDALATRDAIADRLDDLMESAGDATYDALVALRAAMVRDIAARGALLPRVVQYTSPATLPALVVAHRVYGNALRDTDIVDRNNIRHPGAVPGGVALEVLTDA